MEEIERMFEEVSIKFEKELDENSKQLLPMIERICKLPTHTVYTDCDHVRDLISVVYKALYSGEHHLIIPEIRKIVRIKDKMRAAYIRAGDFKSVGILDEFISHHFAVVNLTFIDKLKVDELKLINATTLPGFFKCIK